MNADTSHFFPANGVPPIISGVGILFLLAFAGEWLVFTGVRVIEFFTAAFVVSLLLTLFFTVGIVYGGYWLERSELPHERYPRIGGWFVGGMAVYLAINAPIMAVWPPDSGQFLSGWIRFTLSVGGLGGLLVGVVEARSIERERAAERATTRAEAAETHHRNLDYLNSLLRHEVLNTATVITGYASLLLEDHDLDEDARDRLETISRQSRDMTDVIEDVQVLLRMTQGDADVEPQNLSAALTEELDDLRHTYESVEIEATVPDGVRVRADDLLARVFSNLLANAVEHHDGRTPRVEVTVEESGETVTVRVADDGPGIPEAERAALFERDDTGGTHGLGLYLVRTLVERYGGSVELAETGPEGSTFAVELPAAKSESPPSGGEAVASGPV